MQPSSNHALQGGADTLNELGLYISLERHAAATEC